MAYVRTFGLCPGVQHPGERLYVYPVTDRRSWRDRWFEIRLPFERWDRLWAYLTDGRLRREWRRAWYAPIVYYGKSRLEPPDAA